MSVVFNAPAAPSSVAPQNAALASAHNSARLVYEKLCAERNGTLRRQVSSASSWPVASQIAKASPAISTDMPLPTAYPVPSGMHLPSFRSPRSGSVGPPPVSRPSPSVSGAMRQVSAPLPMPMQASPSIPLNAPVTRMTTNPVPLAPRPDITPPVAPESLLDPVAVDKQKLNVARSLLDRLQTSTAALTQQNQDRKKLLAEYGAQQKAQHATQVDSDLQRQAKAIEQRGNSQLMQIQQAVHSQKAALDNQAATLVHTYHAQKAAEEKIQSVFGSRSPSVAQNQQVQRNALRDVDSFDSYLGKRGAGRPKPPPSDDLDD